MDEAGNIVCIVCVGAKQHAKQMSEEDAVPRLAATGWYHSRTVRKGRKGLKDPLSPEILRLLSMCRHAAQQDAERQDADQVQSAEHEYDVVFPSGLLQ